MTPVVLGIDPSTNLGWAVLSRTMKAPKTGLLTVPPPSEVGHPTAMDYVYRKVGEIIDEHGVTHGFIEAPILVIKNQKHQKHQPEINLTSRLVLFKVELAVELAFFHRKLPDVSWAYTWDWRERFIGRSKAPPGVVRAEAKTAWFKAQAIAACARRDLYITDHNIAEACGIADFGLAVVDPVYRAMTDATTRRAEIAPIED